MTSGGRVHPADAFATIVFFSMDDTRNFAPQFSRIYPRRSAWVAGLTTTMHPPASRTPKTAITASGLLSM